MVKVSLVYILQRYSFGVDDISNLGTKLRNARDSVLEKYGKGVTLSTWLQTYPSGEQPHIITHFEEMVPGSLENALAEYFSLVGVPSYVKGGSDYGVVKKVLEPLGQTLRTPILAALTLHPEKKVSGKGWLPQLI